MKVSDLVHMLRSLVGDGSMTFLCTPIDAKLILESADKMEKMSEQIKDVCAASSCDEYCPMWNGEEGPCKLGLMDL